MLWSTQLLFSFISLFILDRHPRVGFFLSSSKNITYVIRTMIFNRKYYILIGSIHTILFISIFILYFSQFILTNTKCSCNNGLNRARNNELKLKGYLSLACTKCTSYVQVTRKNMVLKLNDFFAYFTNTLFSSF